VVSINGMEIEIRKPRVTFMTARTCESSFPPNVTRDEAMRMNLG